MDDLNWTSNYWLITTLGVSGMQTLLTIMGHPLDYGREHEVTILFAMPITKDKFLSGIEEELERGRRRKADAMLEAREVDE